MEKEHIFNDVSFSELKIKSLGIEWTQKCTAKCDICCYECSMQNEGKIDVINLKKWVKNFKKEFPEVDKIAITGGEPFLYYNELVDFFKFAQELGYSLNIITNCYWAKNDDITINRLSKLTSLGLEAIAVSLDPSHLEWVPIEKIKRVLRIATDLKTLTVNINGSFYTEDNLDNYFTDNEKYIMNKAKKLGSYPVFPVGRAKKHANKIQWKKKYTDFWCGFAPEIYIRTNGNVYPCCSISTLQDALCFGNIYKDSPKKIGDSLLQNLFIMLAKYSGFDKLEEIVKLYYPEFSLPKKDYDVCYLCNSLCNNSEKYNLTKKAIAKFEKDYIEYVFTNKMQQTV